MGNRTSNFIKLSLGDRIANKVTGTMATWTFIFTFLSLCGLEIWWNHTEIVISHHLAFDPSTIILNLILSLIAAVQGSIIMIAQNAQARRDEARELRMQQMTEKIEDQTTALVALAESAHSHDEREEKIMEQQHEILRLQSQAIREMSELIESLPEQVKYIIQDELNRVVEGG